LEAAAEVIAERGYRDATLAEIARRAGYSHGLITLRFGSKDGLLQQLLEDFTRTWQQNELRPAVSGTVGVDSVTAPLDATRATARRQPAVARCFYGLLFEALRPVPALRDRARELHREHRAAVASSVRHGIDSGTIAADVDPEAVASMVLSVMRGAAYQWLLDPDFDFDGTLAVFTRQLTTTLTSPAAAQN
jgi:AcrR family transcriptional regulator